jgi:hypothetical protein
LANAAAIQMVRNVRDHARRRLPNKLRLPDIRGFFTALIVSGTFEQIVALAAVLFLLNYVSA